MWQWVLEALAVLVVSDIGVFVVLLAVNVALLCRLRTVIPQERPRQF